MSTIFNETCINEEMLHIYIYIYIYIYTHTHLYTNTHVCVCVCVCVYISLCMFVYTYLTQARTHTHVCICPPNWKKNRLLEKNQSSIQSPQKERIGQTLIGTSHTVEELRSMYLPTSSRRIGSDKDQFLCKLKRFPSPKPRSLARSERQTGFK